MYSQPVIFSEQHCFIKGKSCSTQLTGVYHEIVSYLDSSIQTDILYLDFSKVFDSVSHRLLLHKFKMYDFNGLLQTGLPCLPLVYLIRNNEWL